MKILPLVLAALLLTGCGGGGSSSTSTPTVTVTVPGAPTGVSATAGNASASIAFMAPATTGGATITGYTASCTGGGATRTATGTSSPLSVTTLTNGTAYACTVAATNSAGTGAASTSASVTPSAGTSGSFTLTSTAGIEGATMAADYTCDGTGSSPQLTWSNPPAGTTEFAVLMTTLPGDGTTKWNWVMYGIPAATRSLAKDSFGLGTPGVGSDGPFVGYQPPCSQGPGAKVYTFTVYALSGSPSIAATPVSGAALTSAMSNLTLGTAVLNLSFTRATTPTGGTTACGYVRGAIASSSGASVSCDATYAYVSSSSIASHTMMDGITATNLQIPVQQNFLGANGWKIPLAPAVAASTTTAVDGPIGIAVNGVMIFNPCKQGGCANGDTKVLGELDVCNGHAGRADDYHYHAAPSCLMATKAANYWDTHPLGWALDGFAIFGYNNADGTVATRDSVCGGNTSSVTNAPAGYSYHVTDASPYVLSCFRGTPSPDLAGQGGKYSPFRQPPVTPFRVSNMTLTTAGDGYSVLQFTSAISFTTTETGTDSYTNAAGTYRVRYKQLTGTALSTQLALPANSSKSACWSFQFTDGSGNTTQPATNYCR